MNEIMYAASLPSLGKPSVIKITISKETPKTISISHKEFVVGAKHLQYFGYKRVYKDNLFLFDTLTEALEYLVKGLENDVEYLKLKMRQNKQAISELEVIRLNNA